MSLDLTSDFLQNKFAMPEASKNGMYTFDRYKLDAEKLMLYRDEIEIKLPPKVVKTLAVLIEHRGSILSKDELIEKVWSDSIVEESNLSQNLYVLRKSLGSRPDGSPYIETLRRRGYRFTADVQLVERSSDLLNGSQAPAPRPSVGVERRGNVLRLVDWSAAQMPDEARVPAATRSRGEGSPQAGADSPPSPGACLPVRRRASRALPHRSSVPLRGQPPPPFRTRRIGVRPG